MTLRYSVWPRAPPCSFSPLGLKRKVAKQLFCQRIMNTARNVPQLTNLGRRQKARFYPSLNNNDLKAVDVRG